MQKLPDPKFQFGDVVDLATPQVLIVGVHYRGNPDQVEVRYDVVHDGQIQEGVPESAIVGINEMETARQRKNYEAHKAAVAAEELRRKQLQDAKRRALGTAIGGAIAGGQGQFDDGQERRASVEDPSYAGPFRRSSDATQPCAAGEE